MQTDLFIIGGGINAAAIASEASHRGLQVVLAEKNDFASGTSSKSSRMIHGGLRYLENYEFSMVRDSLRERDVLLNKAPHLVKPLNIIIPYNKTMRSKFLIRLGLFIYDNLWWSKYFSKARYLQLKNSPFAENLQDNINASFVYADARTFDARLVMSYVLDAHNNGAKVLNYQNIKQIIAEKDFWKIVLQDKFSLAEQTIEAQCVINAAGPWIDEVNKNFFGEEFCNLSLVKGSHIIVKKFYQHENAFLLQNDDTRVVFVLPLLKDYLIIGTTDIEVSSNELDNCKISQEEINYLLQVVNKYFSINLKEEDIIKTYSGIRPLKKANDSSDSPSKISREYEIDVNKRFKLPWLTIVGGKLTIHRRLALDCMQLLQEIFPQQKAFDSSKNKLPGADFLSSVEYFKQELKIKYHFISEELLEKYVDAYGTLCLKFLAKVNCVNDLGKKLFADVYEVELNYLRECEFVKTDEDCCRRRALL